MSQPLPQAPQKWHLGRPLCSLVSTARRPATTLILGAAYTLWLVKRVIFGKVGNHHVAEMKDLNGREFLVLGVLAVSVVLLGVWPAPLLDMMRGSIEHLTQMILATKL